MVMAWDAVERMMKLQEVICRALAGTLTWLQAADILGMHPRTVRRWRARSWFQNGSNASEHVTTHSRGPSWLLLVFTSGCVGLRRGTSAGCPDCPL